MKGYKVFNSDWTCRGFQYEVGKTYEMNEIPRCCRVGFHFCENLIDCFNYYEFNPNNKVAEIDAVGDIDKKENKKCTNKIYIVKELSWEEVLKMCNTGNYNTGYCNTGNYNSGNHNSDNYNSGNYNTGYCNTGNHNSGYYNSGDYNTGYCNTGNYNSGNHNSGNRNTGCCNSGNHNSGYYNSGDRNTGRGNIGCHNSGYYNSGDYNTGYCNSNSPKIRLFNYETELDFDSYEIDRLKNILNSCPQSHKYSNFVYKCDMTKEEIERHPESKTINGYVKTVIIKANKKEWWDKLDEEDKDFIKSLPHYDEKIFFECMGIEE